jgi:hypothetical protein
MADMDSLFDCGTGTPTHINPETGVKWWLDKSSTNYARTPLPNGKGALKEAVAWVVERPDGHRTRLLTVGQEILAENQGLEAFGAEIDMLKVATQFN